ncbi:MAG TPA: hypothetical protein VH583_12945 [Vicinamibacterales bacterium]
MTLPGRRLAVALLCAPTIVHAADASDRVARTLPLPPGRAVRVEATIADVTIVGSDRPDLAVEIMRRAPTSSDLARYPVVIDSSDDVVRIAAVQTNDGRDARLKTEMVIRAPSAARLDAVRVFEGRVRLSDLTAACDVDIQRGNIEANALSGRVRLESGVGSVALTDAALVAGGMLRLRTFNGPVRLQFARPPDNARILALTFNGVITSDIPLSLRDTFGPRFGETTIGTGDPVVSIDAVKGDIAISVDRR